METVEEVVLRTLDVDLQQVELPNPQLVEHRGDVAVRGQTRARFTP